MKTPVLESLFDKNAGFQACSFIKKRLQSSCFPANIAKLLRPPFLKNICERLLQSVLRNLSQAFDCINHDLAIAQLDTYGVGKSSF